MPDFQDPKQVNNNDLRNTQFGGGFINAENVNAGRIGGDIYNIYLGQQATSDNSSPSPQDSVITQPIKIKLKTSDGSESASLRAAAHWISGVKQDKTVTLSKLRNQKNFRF